MHAHQKQMKSHGGEADMGQNAGSQQKQNRSSGSAQRRQKILPLREKRVSESV